MASVFSPIFLVECDSQMLTLAEGAVWRGENMRHRLSTTQVTRLLHVSVASATSWVDQDQLVAGRTPGGHRGIEVDNLVRFLRHQKLRVPPVFVNRNPKVPVADDEATVAAWLPMRSRPGIRIGRCCRPTTALPQATWSRRSSPTW